MTKNEFSKLFKDRIVILDGAMGTMLQQSGMPTGVCPEKWATLNSELVGETQKSYVDADSDIIYTFTFGANPIKLAEFGLSEETYEINKTLAQIARKAAGESCLVAGDISSCGSLLQPFGTIGFEQAVENFKSQAKGLIDGGVDLFAIETMMDLQEARAALIAIKELCDKPIMVTLTYEGDRTLMGNDPVSSLITLQSLGADAVGCNCSSGPAEMVGLIRQMKPYAKVPLIAKANAGKPHLENGKTVFNMDAEGFSVYAEELVAAGANAIGGCCGTTPAFIKALKDKASAYMPVQVETKKCTLASSNRKTVQICDSMPFTIIGERLNPTGKKALKEALTNGNMDLVSSLAREQVEAGAMLLDVNAGVPGIDESETLKSMVNAITNSVSAPILIDTSNPDALEAALRIYPGRAIINSISAESEKINKMLPIAQKYGAMFVLLPVDDDGVPETADERIKIIEDIYQRAKKLGFSKEDILVDGLAMTIASNKDSALEALKVINWCKNEFDINTTIGLSNVSFGLPSREGINSAFLAMAVANGLTTAILNPNNQQLMQTVKATDAIVGRDENALSYIGLYFNKQVAQNAQSSSSRAINDSETSKDTKFVKDMKSTKNANTSKAQENEDISRKTLYNAILNGDSQSALDLANQAIIKGFSPRLIIDDELIPAIQRVGELYEQKLYFLPQLIRGAEAMEKAMKVLSPEIEGEEKQLEKSLGTIVIATVKGDVHDIGKNIVAMLLKNYGFNVLDLGKDVDAESIIEAVKANNADIVALSALMTTTMNQMPIVMSELKKEGLKCAMMVGGAVVDNKFAQSFGAHYSADAYSAVKLGKKLLNNNKTGC